MNDQDIYYGGPAFPCHTNPMPGRLVNAPQGMTLRDYFAGQALNGWYASMPSDITEVKYDTVAKHCYDTATAMLKQREAAP